MYRSMSVVSKPSSWQRASASAKQASTSSPKGLPGSGSASTLRLRTSRWSAATIWGRSAATASFSFLSIRSTPFVIHFTACIIERLPPLHKPPVPRKNAPSYFIRSIRERLISLLALLVTVAKAAFDAGWKISHEKSDKNKED